MAKPSPLFGALDRLAQSGALEVVALGGLFGGGSRAATPTETVPKPVPLADEADPAVLAARRRALQRAAGRSGRDSTVLSTTEDYSTSKTGVA